MQDFFEGYKIWSDIRFNRIIKHYGSEFFSGKTLLEVGCGNGYLGNRFYELGTTVICMDGREENVELTKFKYPHLKTYTYNLNTGLGIDMFFDIILHAGTLYHLIDGDARLVEACSQCNHLILETDVVDSDTFIILKQDEDKTVLDQSISGVGCQPSIGAVEMTLEKAGFSYIRIRDELDIGFRKYDWDIANTHKFNNGQRAMWMCQRTEVL